MQPLSRNHRPDLLTALMKMSRVLRLPRKMHLRRSSSNAPHLPSFSEMLQIPRVLLTFEKVHNPLRLPRASISDSKSGANMWCFVHFDFDFEMCFATQRRALFRHRNFQRWSRDVRSRCVLYILTSKCASCHNGVHFFDISTSKSGPEMSGAGVFCTF